MPATHSWALRALVYNSQDVSISISISWILLWNMLPEVCIFVQWRGFRVLLSGGAASNDWIAQKPMIDVGLGCCFNQVLAKQRGTQVLSVLCSIFAPLLKASEHVNLQALQLHILWRLPKLQLNSHLSHLSHLSRLSHTSYTSRLKYLRHRLWNVSEQCQSCVGFCDLRPVKCECGLNGVQGANGATVCRVCWGDRLGRLFLEALALAIGGWFVHWTWGTNNSRVCLYLPWLLAKYLQESLPVHFVFEAVTVVTVYVHPRSSWG